MLELADGHRAARCGLPLQGVGFLALGHRLLDDVCDFLGGLREHLVHVLGHRVRVAQVLRGALRRLRV